MQSHPYSVVGARSPGIWLGLALISFILALVLLNASILSMLPLGQSIFELLSDLGPWQSAISGSPLFIIFFLLYTLFDRVIWRWKFFNKLVNCPDLSGSWQGELNSALHPSGLPLKISLKIRQSWRSISIVVESDGTYSNSLTAGVSFSGPDKVVLMNIYDARSKPSGSMKDFIPHHGTNSFLFALNEGKIVDVSGTYYTESGHGSHGTMLFEMSLNAA